MTLPEPIRRYFDADARGDGEALARAFAADAVVHDEGGTYRGPEAILGWWRTARAAYGATATPLGRTETDGRSVVRARVTGTFPGSPAVLTFTFGLAGGLIADLDIR